jgi:hypothetical protein
MQHPQQSGLLKSLNAVLTNAVHVQDFCKVVVGAAVEDAIFRIARDHGLNYKALVDKYKADIVAEHASAAGAAGAGVTCKGITRAHRPCSKRAVINGFCTSHADQWAEDESKRRCVEAYRNDVKCAPTGAAAAALVAGGTAAARGGKPSLATAPLDLL